MVATKNKKTLAIGVVLSLLVLIGLITLWRSVYGNGGSFGVSDHAKQIVKESIFASSEDKKGFEAKQVFDFLESYLNSPDEKFVNCLSIEQVNENGEDLNKKGNVLVKALNESQKILTSSDKYEKIKKIMGEKSVKDLIHSEIHSKEKESKKATDATTSESTAQHLDKKDHVPEFVEDPTILGKIFVYIFFSDSKDLNDYKLPIYKNEAILMDKEEKFKKFKDVILVIKTKDSKTVEKPIFDYAKIVTYMTAAYIKGEPVGQEENNQNNIWPKAVSFFLN